eukprot:12019934-Alexandrium_andersonii.AAC.2
MEASVFSGPRSKRSVRHSRAAAGPLHSPSLTAFTLGGGKARCVSIAAPRMVPQWNKQGHGLFRSYEGLDVP